MSKETENPPARQLFAQQFTESLRPQDAHVVKKYFSVIDVPPDLSYVPAISLEVLRAMKVLRTLGRPEDEQFLSELEFAAKLVWRSRSLLRKMGAKVHPKKKGRDSVHALGKSNSNPLYALLWYQTADDHHQSQFLILKAVLLLIWQDLREETSDDFLRRVGRAARIIGEHYDTSPLDLFPDSPITLEEYASHLGAITSAATKEDDEPSLRNHKAYESTLIVLQAIEVAIGARRYRCLLRKLGTGHSNVHRGKTRGFPPSAQYLREMVDLTATGDGRYPLARNTALEVRSRAGRGTNELTYDDYPSGFELLELLANQDVIEATDPRALALQLKGRKNAWAKSAQQLRCHPASPSVYQISCVISELVRRLALQSEVGNPLEVAPLLFLAVVLVTGRVVGEVENLRVYSTAPEKLPGGCNIAYITSENQFMVRVAAPELRGKLTESQKAAALPVGRYVVLAAGSAFRGGFGSLRLSLKGKEKESPLKLARERHVSNLAKRLLASICKEYDLDVTLAGLSSVMFQRLCEASGHLSMGSLLCGQCPPGGWARNHYATVPSSLVANQYRLALDRLLEECSREVNCDGLSKQFTVPKLKSNISLYVGSPKTPTKTCVRRTVRALKKRLCQLWKRRFQQGGLIRFHNAFTAYVVLMLDFSTGARAVSGKYATDGEFDLDNNGLVISDKDSNDFYHSRLNPLTKTSAEQLCAYLLHAKVMLSILGIQSECRAADEESGGAAEPAKVRGRKKYKEEVLAKTGVFFFVGDDGALDAFDIGRLRLEIEGLYPHKMNTVRHYLRFQLAATIDGEILDAFLGHWSNGTEPGGRFSTFCLEDVNAVLRAEISKIQAGDGWEVIGGLVQ